MVCRLAAVLALIAGFSTRAVAAAAPEMELFLPQRIASDKTEVKVAIEPGRDRILWGVIGASGSQYGGWDIYEIIRLEDGWSDAQPASFNSPANDFDPAFSADGRTLYFFSNREGGAGGDDLWRVTLEDGAWGTAENLGPIVNTANDEWAPTPTYDGRRLLFSSDGHGGAGRHDLLVAHLVLGDPVSVQPLEALNSGLDDFDATMLVRDEGIVFARGIVNSGDDHADLYVSWVENGEFTPPVKLPAWAHCPGSLNIGPTWSPAFEADLFVSSACADRGAGRMDIFRVRGGAAGLPR